MDDLLKSLDGTFWLRDKHHHPVVLIAYEFFEFAKVRYNYAIRRENDRDRPFSRQFARDLATARLASGRHNWVAPIRQLPIRSDVRSDIADHIVAVTGQASDDGTLSPGKRRLRMFALEFLISKGV